jgi:hypothetical protein
MTTQWQNMFDAGNCTVDVLTGTTSLYSGTLGKDDDSDTFTHASRTFQVSVDSSGVVTLSCSDASSAGGFTLAVSPTYDISALALKVSDITVLGSPNGDALNGGAADPIDLAFDADTGAATPDPVTFDAAADATGVAVEAQGGT